MDTNNENEQFLRYKGSKIHQTVYETQIFVHSYTVCISVCVPERG